MEHGIENRLGCRVVSDKDTPWPCAKNDVVFRAKYRDRADRRGFLQISLTLILHFCLVLILLGANIMIYWLSYIGDRKNSV